MAAKLVKTTFKPKKGWCASWISRGNNVFITGFKTKKAANAYIKKRKLKTGFVYRIK